MPYVLEFEIKGLPKLLNALLRGRMWGRIANARTWKTLTHAACLGRLPKEPLKRARVTLIRHSTVRPDPDGLVASFKPVLDGLKLAGVIAEDKHANIGMPDYDWAHAPRKHGKIFVRVEEI